MSDPGGPARHLGRDLVAELATIDRALLGTWVKIPAVETVELLANAGFDFVVVDMEHSPITLESAYRAILVAQACGMAALARVPDHGGTDAQRLLDCGADGILVPRVNSVEDAERALGKLVFPPAGERGMGRTSRAGLWGLAPMEDYRGRGTASTLRCVQLEELRALREVRRILEVPNLGAVFIGMGDLTMSAGRPASDPEIAQLVGEVLASSRAAGIPIGTAVTDAMSARRAVEQGFRFVMVSNDAGLFGQAAIELVRASKTDA
jgi:2-dehydro-3-deoxyglucarate aldolase/4-hydroxy-2-oxoheptanedioate aldolase